MYSFIVFSFLLHLSLGLRILSVLPHPGKSHFRAFEPLLDELAARGHQLTVVSFFPKKEPTENYRDVDISGAMDVLVDALPVSAVEGLGPLADFHAISQIGVDTCDRVLGHLDVASLLNSTYDLALTELFTTDCFLGLVDAVGAPFLALSSSSIFPTTDARFGNPEEPAFVPNMFLPYSDRMTLLQRTTNFFINAAMHFYKSYYYDPLAEELIRKHVGTVRPIKEIKKDTSLVLANRHFSANLPRPLQPSVIEVGGLHIKPAKSLPPDLESFMENAEEGVVFFSLGSVLDPSSLPRRVLEDILRVFSQLPQRVLFKYSSPLEEVPDNVLIRAWFPQRDLLEHPKMRLVITHGGLLSTSEAVACGVPMLGIPMFGDQSSNLVALEARGVALILPYNQLNYRTLSAALFTLLNDTTYADNAKELSAVYLDRPLTPLETAVFWTEYVARHPKALRSKAASLTFYQRYLLDMYFIILLVALLTTILVYYSSSFITDKLLGFIYDYKNRKLKHS